MVNKFLNKSNRKNSFQLDNTELDAILNNMHPSATSLGLANLASQSNFPSGLVSPQEKTFSPSGIFNTKNRNQSTLGASFVSGTSENFGASLKSSKKMSITPARTRAPRILVGPGTMAVLSDKFWTEQ